MVDTAWPILVFGDDGSVGADVAWLWVNNHRWPGWQIDVVHATRPAIVAPPLEAPPPLRPWDPPTPRVAFSESGVHHVRHLTVELDPRIALDSCAYADLLVVGARGRGLLKSLGVGSTTDWLLQQPLAPVVVVRSGRPTRRALVCVDGSPHATAAVAAFATLPWLGNVEVVVLGVDDGRALPGPGCQAAGATLALVAGGVRTVVTQGAATDAILDAIEREPVDVVVLGTRGLTGLARLRVGSTANAVARNGTCTTFVAIARPGPDDKS